MLCRPVHSFDKKKSRMLFLVLIAFLKKQNITAFFSAQTSEYPSLCKYIFLREEKKEKKSNKNPTFTLPTVISSGGYKSGF